MRRFNFLYALIFCAICVAKPGVAQNAEPFTCFNTQAIQIPLTSNDFSKSEILKSESRVNALYYLYQDKYTFWYKIVAGVDAEIKFSVSPSNEKDRYRVVAFNYPGDDFCDQLINDSIQPVEMDRRPMRITENRLIYIHTIQAKKGEEFYVSVLSLNNEDCGHFLHVESLGEKLSLHAIHKPCYDFSFFEVPSFHTNKVKNEDVAMVDFSFDSEKDTSSSAPDPNPVKTVPEEPADPFASITTVEVQKQEEGIVSAGDKLVLNQVFFYNNTYALKPGAEEELDQLLNFLIFNNTVSIEIQGHTANNAELILPDPTFKKQGKEWNFKGSAFELSEKRAQAVRDYLIEKGVEKKRLQAVGYGDTQKRIPNASSFEDFEKNMRVEILVLSE